MFSVLDPMGRDRKSATSPTAAAIVRGAVAVASIAASVVALRTCQQAPQRNLQAAGHALHDAFGSLFVGEVTTRFVSMAPELSGGSALELATLRVPERLEREQVRRFLGLQARAEVAIEVPVTYRYSVPWDHGWRVTLTAAPTGEPTAGAGRGVPGPASGRPTRARLDAAPGPGGDTGAPDMVQLCLVDAPALEPALPPAIDTRSLRIERTKEWALQRFPAAMTDSLLAQLTPLTTERAASVQYKALVRETARRRLAQFVRLWVLRQEEVGPGHPVQVIVRFADDEVGVGATARLSPWVEVH